MSKIKLDEINIMNIKDIDYYDSIFDITVLISNIINPVFRIYANNVEMALEILVEMLVELNSINIIATEIEEYEENYYNVNEYWIDLNYINVIEVY